LASFFQTPLFQGKCRRARFSPSLADQIAGLEQSPGRTLYTTIIDGFIVSPGVEIERVTTEDLSFMNSDHQPVRLRARRLDSLQSI
jgi:hypothetical protein